MSDKNLPVKSQSEELEEDSEEGKVALMTEEVTIFAMDCSSSMCERFGSGSSYAKFGSMLKAAEGMLGERKRHQEDGSKDSIGIISFGGSWIGRDVNLVAYPGPVSDKMVAAVAAMKSGGSTPMEEAVEKSFDLLEQSAAGLGRIVLMSDGQPNGGPSAKVRIINLVRITCETTGFIVDTVGIGDQSESGAYGYDEEFMRSVAAAGNGDFYNCDEASKLSQRLLAMESERRALLATGVLLLPASTE